MLGPAVSQAPAGRRQPAAPTPLACLWLTRFGRLPHAPPLQASVDASSLLSAAEGGPCFSDIQQALGGSCGAADDGALQLTAACCRGLAAAGPICWSAMQGTVM